MRTSLLLVVCVINTMLQARNLRAEPRDTSAPDIHTANRRLGRGINLGNALDAPTEGQWGVTLKAGYFRAIKQAGFDTVRLPARWSAHAETEPPYTIDPQFAQRVDWSIDQALANDLNVIVNVHHYDEIQRNPDEHVPRLEALWQQIAERYKDQPDRVYFELLNEPRGQFTDAKWNAAIPSLLAAVRKTNPTRPVIIGPGQWNAIRALNQLELPADDRNIIVTVHFYDPFEFTHQSASWVNGSEKWKGRQWLGTDEEQAAIRESFAQAAAWGKANDHPIFMGEFGAYEAADLDSRVRWTRFVTGEAQRAGFSWAYWEFCSGFGAYDPQTDTWREELKSALIE